jgi:rhamnogalacturonyl hydrolase YesR
MRKKSKNPRAKHKDYLKYLWGTIIYLKDKGTCQICGRNGREPHHYFRSSRANTCYDTRNGVLLCHGCHHWKAHGDSVAEEPVKRWFIKRLGKKGFEAMRIKAEMPVKLDLRMVEVQLLKELNEYTPLPEDYADWSLGKKKQWLKELRK